MERQCWADNQYSRPECLKISGIPENIENKDLENLTFHIFEKTDINVDPANIGLSLDQNTVFKATDNQVL